MKSVCINLETQKPAKKYPYLGYYSDNKDYVVVLFYKINEGVVIGCNLEGKYDNWSIGKYLKNWSEDLFSYYDGEVILSND